METDLMAELACVAHEDRPRLFALYGMTRGDEPRAILGWGMQFRTEKKALFYNPYTSEMHHASSADQVHRRFTMFGEVRLDWLDGSELGEGEGGGGG